MLKNHLRIFLFKLKKKILISASERARVYDLSVNISVNTVAQEHQEILRRHLTALT